MNDSKAGCKPQPIKGYTSFVLWLGISWPQGREMGKSRVYTGAVHKSKAVPYGVGWNAGLRDRVVLPTQSEASKLSGKPKARMYRKNSVFRFRSLGTIYDLLYGGNTILCVPSPPFVSLIVLGI